MRNQKGFSLIELMIVVAIIGILAAIAVPNFQKYQAKSRQAEAKNLLSGIYTAEKAWNAEWTSYSTDFGHIGFTPEGDMRFDAGFGANFVTVPGNYTGPAAITQRSTSGYCGGPGNCAIQSVIAPNAPAAAAVATATTFIAEANGDIDGDTDQDQWRINEAKALTLLTNDLD